MNSTYDYHSISDFLGAEFSRRKLRNETYSLRAFARDLEVSPSRLSEILSGKHGLSEKTADKIAENLRLKPRDRQFWRDLILSESARNEKVRELAKVRLDAARNANSHVQIKEDQFRVISDWYHAAILELTQVKGFRSDLFWISDRLGITMTDTQIAIERLMHLNLLKIDNSGNWLANPDVFSTFSETPSIAIRRFHRQILSMHIESLIQDPMEDRITQSMIVAIPKSSMADFHLEFQKFISQFWQKIEPLEKDDLYSMSLQLCPIRNRRKKGSSS